MATVAALFRRTEAELMAGALGAREYPAQETDPFRLRPLPSEDVYFFSKRIDNSRVVREADPAAGRKCWRAVSVSFVGAVLLILLLLPNALGTMAGYQIHTLEREREQLLRHRSVLEFEEASLLSPERLQELARDLRLVDPAPDRVVYLNPPADGSLALNVPSK